MDIRTATFTTREICDLVGIPVATFQSDLRRKFVSVGHIEGGGKTGTGNRREYKFTTLMEVVVANALRPYIKDTATCYHVAKRFAHTGTDGRFPALPFGDGGTLLFISGKKFCIVNDVPGCDYDSDVRAALGNPEVFLRLDLLHVFERVVNGLELGDPRDVLAASYGEAK